MDYINVTPDNIETEHICCAISNSKDCQVVSKKSWLCDRFDDGLVFLKGDVRGKCFIEYIPAEKAWAPVSADGYMYIGCLWVSGQFQGHGYSNELLDKCIEDSKQKGKKGLVTLSSKKKAGFLADPKFLRYKGFELADSAEPYFELMYLPFDSTAVKPHFKDVIGKTNEQGLWLYYTNQCPFTAKYVPILENVAKAEGVALHTVHIKTTEEAQSAPCPFTTFSLFYNSKFITHEIQSEKKFIKILTDIKENNI